MFTGSSEEGGCIQFVDVVYTYQYPLHLFHWVLCSGMYINRNICRHQFNKIRNLMRSFKGKHSCLQLVEPTLLFPGWIWNIFQRYEADEILVLTEIHRTGSMKHGWVIIFGSSVRTCNESSADVRRRTNLARVVIGNMVVGGDFWKFCAIERIKVNGGNYDFILGISTYYI